MILTTCMMRHHVWFAPSFIAFSFDVNASVSRYLPITRNQLPPSFTAVNGVPSISTYSTNCLFSITFFSPLFLNSLLKRDFNLPVTFTKPRVSFVAVLFVPVTAMTISSWFWLYWANGLRISLKTGWIYGL